MNKKAKGETIEELMKKEISSVEVNDRLAKLEKERARDKKVIAEYKEREKSTARALVLYERKIKYLKETLIDDILVTCKKLNASKDELEMLCKRIVNDILKEEMMDFADNLTLFETELYEVCNKLEANAAISKKDRAFIANKPFVDENQPVDADSRFDRLKMEFAQKVGSSVTRKRGRPKKNEQSIVADLGLGKKVENKVKARDEVEDKFNELFYTVPTNQGVKSSIPQTADSMFDFDEALNPNASLKDIMADLMSDKEDRELKTYGQDPKLKEIEEAEKQAKVELLESGFIRNPMMHKRPTPVVNRTIDQMPKKPTFEKRFLAIQNIVKDSNSR